MGEDSTVFVGIDAAKAKHAVALAEPGRRGEVRYLGEIDTSPEAVRKLVTRLAAKHGTLHVCYEAGPTGYGLYRQIVALGHSCTVVAPSLIPRKPGERVKTNRRDALSLARLLRAGELTAVWVPDEAHEAMRDLVRAREAAMEDLRRKRQAITSLLLKQGRTYPGKKTWGAKHGQWLQKQTFTHQAHTTLLQELLLGERHARERLERLDAGIERLLPEWSLVSLVAALQALRGVSVIGAVTIAAEVGDLGRFESARQFMSYLGLVPGERSTGETVRRLGITKAGNGRLRRVLIEGAWTYRHPPRNGKAKCLVLAGQPSVVKDIAWKAQARLCARYRALSARGKKLTVAVTAVARELAGFVWAIGQEVKPA